jgi:hypothetical protein
MEQFRQVRVLLPLAQGRVMEPLLPVQEWGLWMQVRAQQISQSRSQQGVLLLEAEPPQVM